MRREAEESPWGARAFAVVFLMLVFLIIDKVGVFAPGPVLRDLAIEASVLPDNKLEFSVSGTKVTDDTLRSRAASWIFSDGTPQSIPMPAPSIIFGAGDRFRSQRVITDIPPAALTDAGTILRICFVYDPGMSCTESRLQDIAG